LEIEDPAVGNHRAKSLLVVPHQPVHGVATKAGPHGPGASGVNVRLPEHFIGRGEDILHRLSTPITADLIVPRLAKTGKSATVRSQDDVSLGGHEMEIPAEGEP